jgi:hypothetical protein
MWVHTSCSPFRRSRSARLTSVLLPAPCAGDTLQPFCPALGAAIMGQHIMSIGSNQNFSIPINVLDAFGSKARSGPGSNWIVALSQNSGDTRQLSGNLRGALSGGYVVLQGLSIQAQPGSKLNLTLSAVPPPGSGDKVMLLAKLACASCTPAVVVLRWSCPVNHTQLSQHTACLPAAVCNILQVTADSAAVLCFMCRLSNLPQPLSAGIAVLVRPCVAGEYAIFTRDISTAGQRSITSVSCRTCAAPLFSFSAYPGPGGTETASERTICRSCPDRGVCVAGAWAGMLPRSAVARSSGHCKQSAAEPTRTFTTRAGLLLFCSIVTSIPTLPKTLLPCNRHYCCPSKL